MFITAQDFKRWNFRHFARNGKHRELRLGQSFCNYFNITDPELFHARDYNKAMELIIERYLEKDVARDEYRIK